MEKNNIVTEENITVNDFERVCRTCLSTVDLKPISYVFDFAYFPVEIALNKYTQVQFDPLDNFPKQICSNCVKSLNSSYDFLLNCDSVNTTLKECLTRHERNLLTRICVPNALPMEYVNCEIKQEVNPGEFDSFESNQQPVVPHYPQIETLHMSLDIKEEAPDNSEDEHNSDNDDPDGEQMATNVISKETAKRRSKGDLQIDTNRLIQEIQPQSENDENIDNLNSEKNSEVWNNTNTPDYKIFKKDFESFKEEMRSNMVEIKNNIQSYFLKITNYLDRIEKKLENNSTQPRSTKTIQEEPPDLFSFPVHTEEDVEILEQKIRTDGKYKLKLIEYLSKIGGTSGQEDGTKIGYKIVDHVFSRKLLTHYSWTGVSRRQLSGKKSFQNYQGLLNVFFKVIFLADNRYTIQKTQNLFKDNVLKHAKKRSFRKRSLLETSQNENKEQNDESTEIDGEEMFEQIEDESVEEILEQTEEGTTSYDKLLQ